MRRSTFLPSVLILTWNKPIVALPLQNLTLPGPIGQSQATVDCNNITAAFSETCWDTLNIADYLGNPQTGWMSNVPKCDPSTSSGINKQGCCDELNGEPWSTCYLRLGRGLPGADCSTVSAGACDWDEQQRNAFLR